jgi:EAL domain-containing protein (putative c-di-GMP-specific phosphodiesterase class I)
LDDPDLTNHVAGALSSSHLISRFLTLEITETLLMQRIDVNLRGLQRLCDLGLSLAVDDFGTGYSTLSYLRHLPVQILKIDKSFIDGIEDDAAAETLVRAIVSLARDLRSQIVAAGIETVGQFQRLREMGCHTGQGFLFGRPMTAEELTDRLENRPTPIARRLEVRIPA